jgi:hypothetical protein
MAQYQGKELFVEKSKRDGRLFTPEEQISEIPFVDGSELIETTEDEIKAGVEYYLKYKQCKLHMVYDTSSWIYHERICGICGQHIAFI